MFSDDLQICYESPMKRYSILNTQYSKFQTYRSPRIITKYASINNNGQPWKLECQTQYIQKSGLNNGYLQNKKNFTTILAIACCLPSKTTSVQEINSRSSTGPIQAPLSSPANYLRLKIDTSMPIRRNGSMYVSVRNL